MKKRLLVYAHYFYPDVASTGQILTELCEGLQDDFDITVICVVPSYDGKVDEKYKKKRIYNEKFKNINVIRVRVPEFNKRNKISRIKNILAYFFNAIFTTFRVGKQDIVFSISQPPILGGLLGTIGKWIKRAKFVYNIQDFNPEQAEAIGYAKNKVLIEFARTLDKFSCKQSNVVVVVGRDMQETLNKRFKGKKVPKNVVINNWIDEKQVYPLPKDHPKVREFRKQYGLEDKFVFMYSGNLGLYYDLENIIKVIGEFKDRDDVVFAFVGGGNMKQTLVDYVNENGLTNVKFIPYQKKEDLIYSLNAADVHIVTNAKGIKGISVPSKVYGIMGTGKTILGILEEGSEARLIIEESNCGICSNPGEYKNLKEKIDLFIQKKHNLTTSGVNGRRYLEKHLTKRKSIEKYKDLIVEN
ncbi:glycosyltransferase family 4 protein [Fonticella tunisiensis]|uniref:Glycosyltransferase involved in cell wall biosynthesis n=1 Tax=Fonticella tunisiensis TaxID=1096341 RepID=A0A4R7K7Y8_9CLOT|nr:glycosyltransferase family 4 protein [Fonticella tunisiensis]TDT46084.1 glycosyltransferase involved in cell wall biosynthesis [Fonticella tunisiensis]